MAAKDEYDRAAFDFVDNVDQLRSVSSVKVGGPAIHAKGRFNRIWRWVFQNCCPRVQSDQVRWRREVLRIS